MVFLQPEYFKLFFLLVLLVPLWLFYFSASATPANVWAPLARCKRSLTSILCGATGCVIC